MHFLGRPQPAPVVLACECEARVLDEIGLKSEITCHPDRRFQRVVRNNAEHDERVDLCEAKQAIELGADKRAIRVLDDNGLARQRAASGLNAFPGCPGR